MEFFADTADPDEIAYCFSRGVNDGITTNPKIMQIAGIRDFRGACKRILDRYPNVPVSLETDLRRIPISELESRPEKVRDVLLAQAHEIAQLGRNAVIKIPVCSGGILAARELAREGVKTNVTACSTPYQALAAAKGGGAYVSLFANRMLDGHIFELSGHALEEITPGDPSWRQVVSDNKARYLEQAWQTTLRQIAYTAEQLGARGYEARLIIGSIRDPIDISRVAQAEPHIITITPKVIKGLDGIASLKRVKRSIRTMDTIVGNSILHPVTTYTLEEFERAADSYRKS